MAQMIRKQINIEPLQEASLKKQASLLGVTEAEVIRRTIDRQMAYLIPGASASDSANIHGGLQRRRRDRRDTLCKPIGRSLRSGSDRGGLFQHRGTGRPDRWVEQPMGAWGPSIS